MNKSASKVSEKLRYLKQHMLSAWDLRPKRDLSPSTSTNIHVHTVAQWRCSKSSNCPWKTSKSGDIRWPGLTGLEPFHPKRQPAPTLRSVKLPSSHPTARQRDAERSSPSSRTSKDLASSDRADPLPRTALRKPDLTGCPEHSLLFHNRTNGQILQKNNCLLKQKE